MKRRLRLSRKQVGSLGEKIAVDYLKRLGFSILETNYSCPLGEIDIVAQGGEELVFVEVRTKTSLSFGAPEESLTPAKKSRLIDLAQTYIQEHENLPSAWRIDLLALELAPDGTPRRIELFENAIS